MNPMRCAFALRIATAVGPPQESLQCLVIALSYLSLRTAQSTSNLRGLQPTRSKGWAVISTVFHILPEERNPTLVPQLKYRVCRSTCKFEWLAQPADSEAVRDDVRPWGLVGDQELLVVGPLVHVGVVPLGLSEGAAPWGEGSRSQR